MYIPIWLIVIIVIGWYFYSRSQEENKNVHNHEQNFSYKLDISIEPNWREIYKELVNPKSDKEWNKIINEKTKDLKKKDTENLFGRRYHFTEYYDSVSGLTTKLQKTICSDGKEYSNFVNEFGDSGYVFDSDASWNYSIHDDEKRTEKRDRLAVEITEDGIYNNIFDEFIGGKKSFYKKEDVVLNFPLYEVFNFLFALGQRFHDTENNTVIKWPKQIEKAFKKSGIKYEKYFDYEPEEFDIEKHDKDFFEKWGKPKISLYSSDRFHSTYLVFKNKTYYSVRLKIFRPEENDRISQDNLWLNGNNKIN